MIKKSFLYTPGPSQIPEEILFEMSKPLIHHRTSEFKKIVEENKENLKKIFITNGDIITLTSSGTGAMEAAISNFFSKNDKILVLSAGKFQERFAEIANRYELNVIEYRKDYGMDFKREEVEEILNKNKDIKGISCALCETSSGVVNNIKELAGITKDREIIFIVDGISGIGALEFYMDEWGVDVALAGSQKAFMLPPGLSFIALSKKAKSFMYKSNLPKYYFDLIKELKNLENNTTSWTPAISLFRGLNIALKMILEEGLENVWKRHYINAEAIRIGIKALNLKLLPDIYNAKNSNTVSAILPPQNISCSDIVKLMKEKYNTVIAGGQGSLKNKIFRIGHIGYFNRYDVLIALQALEFALKKLSYRFDEGISIYNAQKFLLNNM